MNTLWDKNPSWPSLFVKKVIVPQQAISVLSFQISSMQTTHDKTRVLVNMKTKGETLVIIAEKNLQSKWHNYNSKGYNHIMNGPSKRGFSDTGYSHFLFSFLLTSLHFHETFCYIQLI